MIQRKLLQILIPAWTHDLGRKRMNLQQNTRLQSGNQIPPELLPPECLPNQYLLAEFLSCGQAKSDCKDSQNFSTK